MIALLRQRVLFGALCLALAGCGGPVSASRVDPKVVQHDLARSAVTTGDPSWETRNVLRERGLVDIYTERPEKGIGGAAPDHGQHQR